MRTGWLCRRSLSPSHVTPLLTIYFYSLWISCFHHVSRLTSLQGPLPSLCCPVVCWFSNKKACVNLPKPRLRKYSSFVTRHVDLTSSFNSMGIKDVVAFTAIQLQPCLTVLMFVDYAQCVLVEGFPLNASFLAILAATSHGTLPRHTNIIHLRYICNPSKLCITEYLYTHEKTHSWGHHLPAACDKCKSLRPWSKLTKSKSTLIFTCKHCPKDTKVICFPKLQGWMLLHIKDMDRGRWMCKSH
jgi:hypothetical protein